MKKLSRTLICLGLASSAGPALAAPPAWVDKPYGSYAKGEFIVGVGKGTSQQAADTDARAEISRVFESKVSAVMKDFSSAAQTVNSSGKGVSVEVQAIQQFQQVVTQKTLSGSEIRERGKDGATFYALATLARGQCAASLKDQIGTLDGKISAAVSSAESGDKLKAFKGYGQALNLMDDRESLNAMLRICDTSGKGIDPPTTIEELAGKFDEAAGDFKLGIVVDGTGGSKIRDCIMQGLGDKGYQIEEISVEEDEEDEEEEEEEDSASGFDAILKGEIKVEKGREFPGSVNAKANVTLKLINGQTKKVLKTWTGSREEGRRDIKSAASLAAFKVCQKLVPDMIKGIDQYFKK